MEDIGPSTDQLGYGHLVVVNDTRITLQDAFSLHPSIAIDSSGNTHVAWMDGRAYGFEIDVNYEIYYSRLRLRIRGLGWSTFSLPSYGIKQQTCDIHSRGLNNLDSQGHLALIHTCRILRFLRQCILPGSTTEMKLGVRL